MWSLVAPRDCGGALPRFSASVARSPRAMEMADAAGLSTAGPGATQHTETNSGRYDISYLAEPMTQRRAHHFDTRLGFEHKADSSRRRKTYQVFFGDLISGDVNMRKNRHSGINRNRPTSRTVRVADCYVTSRIAWLSRNGGHPSSEVGSHHVI